MNTYQPNVFEMLASPPNENEGVPRPKHPNATRPETAAFCEMTMGEQWAAQEDRNFERRLKVAIWERHDRGWNHTRLEDFASYHRNKWTRIKMEAGPAPGRHDHFHDAAAAPFSSDNLPDFAKRIP